MDLAADNAESAYWYAIGKDSAAKTWWNGEPSHPAVYRALRIDPNDLAAWYAAAPFRIGRVDDKPIILAAWPAPRCLSDYPEDWLEIEAVIAWDPVSGTATLPDDATPQLVGAFAHTGPGRVFGNAFAFFRAWAEERASFFTAWKAAKDAHWLATPVEVFSPGMLIVGALKDVRLPIHEMPRDLECVGIDPAEINRAIMRTARLPRAGNSLRAVA